MTPFVPAMIVAFTGVAVFIKSIFSKPSGEQAVLKQLTDCVGERAKLRVDVARERQRNRELMGR